MENTFNLKKFLVENKLTSNSRVLSESKVEGIDLNLVKDLQNDPTVQKLHKEFTKDPALAREAAKVVANIVDGSVSESVNEMYNVPQHYRLSPEEIEFANEKGVIRSKYSSDQVYKDMVVWVNDKYNPAMTTEPSDKNPKPEKKDSTLKQVLRSAGAGSALTLAMTPLLIAGTVGFGAAAGPAFLAAALVGALLGIGAGAAATDGFTRNSVVEEEGADLAGEVQAIINAGRKM
jgi:hypothetical protein